MKKIVSVLLALAMLLCLLPTTAFAEGEVTYTLQGGKNYRITNNNLDKNYSVVNDAGNARTFDTVRYYADGGVEDYFRNSTGKFYVNKGGETIITVNDEAIVATLDATQSSYLSFEEIANPALVTYTIQAGKNYRLINNNVDSNYSVVNDAGNARTYDTVRYYADGGVEDYFQNSTGKFYVNKGGETVITVNERDISGYMPYSRKDTLLFYETGDPAIISFTLSSGVQYSLKNRDVDKNYSVISDAGNARTYNTVRYYANGKIEDQGDSLTSKFYVNKGGETTITVNERDITTYMPYSRYETALAFVDPSGNTLTKPSYPKVNQLVPYQAKLTDGIGTVEMAANTTAPINTNIGKVDYIYDTVDVGQSVTLQPDKLETVADTTSATNAVLELINLLTAEQKESAAAIDLATLYAETAVSKAASKEVTGNEIIINKAAVTDLETVAAQTSSAVETALVNGGVTTARLISNTVTLATDETGEITIKIDPDILETQVDKIRVETPTYAITLKVADLKEDLTEVLTITVQDVGSGFAPGNQNKKTTVKVNLPKGKTTNPVTLSLPKDGDDTTYQAVVKTDGSATSSKYNPATTTMDGKVNTSGSYTVQTNQKDFTDIANKSAEMQKAIRYLASKGIINGTSATEFSPDGSINRAEIAALLVRALGKLDNGATNSFTDVKSSDWYYSAAGSSQKCGLINGYTDNTFRGTTTIAKDQILAVAARVLKNEMGYKEPSNPNSYLAKYSDTVTKWAQPEVALATKENLVVYRVDGTFKGESNMTRGDAAIIIYRLFQKIW